MREFPVAFGGGGIPPDLDGSPPVGFGDLFLLRDFDRLRDPFQDSS